MNPLHEIVSLSKLRVLNSLKPPKYSQLVEIFLVFLVGSTLMLILGFTNGLLQYKPVKFSIGIYTKKIVRTLFFPATIEEIFIRVLLIPSAPEIVRANAKEILLSSIVSLSIYIFYHIPVSLIIDKLMGNNTSYFETFTNLPFLFSVFLLGLICTISYLRTGSILPSICFHWIVVTVWLLLLNGVNKLSNNLV
jgi:predicted Abi (CAAX) family protease